MHVIKVAQLFSTFELAVYISYSGEYCRISTR